MLTPVLVLAIVEGWIPQYESMAAVRVAGLLGAVLGGALLLWARHFPRVWLLLHQATPLADSARSNLMPRLDAIMDRCGTSLPRRPAIYRFGAPGGYIMNALALPSLHAPAVAAPFGLAPRQAAATARLYLLDLAVRYAFDAAGGRGGAVEQWLLPALTDRPSTGASTTGSR